MPPNPNTISPETPTNHQPTIRNFLRRSVRESVASVMDIDMSQGDSPESESRKRNREEDSILGPDAPSRGLSDSMINNTSIQGEGGARRRRVSSDLHQPPDNASTPNTLIQQMREIRQAIQNSPDQEDFNHLGAMAQDRSSTSTTMNIQTMVGGIVSLTNQVAPDRDSLLWDNSNLPNHPPPPPSPLPVPNIDLPPQGAAALSDTETGTNHVMAAVRKKMDELAGSLEQILTDGLKDAEEKISQNSLAVQENTRQIELANQRISELFDQQAETRADLHGHFPSIAQTVANDIEILEARISDQESRSEDAVRVLNDNNDAIQNALGHVDRMEGRIAQLSTQAPLLQAILQRVEQLENQSSQQKITIERLEEERLRMEDDATMRTIILRGFRNPAGRNIRQQARNVLAGIGCEDVLHSTQRIQFSNNNQILRLTFPTAISTQDAISWFASSIRQIKEAGRDPGISFTVLTPPRFAPQRRILAEMGHRMKRQGEISRYQFVIKQGNLWMKVSKQGQESRLIQAPPDNQQEEVPMEIQHESTCSICMLEYDEEAKQAVYSCGHLFHLQCLVTALNVSLKCPVCRTIPSAVQDLVADCNTCQSFTRDEEIEETVGNNWTLSQKCGHIHHQRCTELYLITRDCPFPPGPSDLDVIDRNPSMKGCITCQNGQPHNPQAKDLLLYEVSPTTDPPEYIDLGQNLPASLPRAWADGILTVGQLMGSPPLPNPGRLQDGANNGGRRRRELNSPGPRARVTGANAQPIGRRADRQDQGERRQRRQERSRSSRRPRSSH